MAVEGNSCRKKPSWRGITAAAWLWPLMDGGGFDRWQRVKVGTDAGWLSRQSGWSEVRSRGEWGNGSGPR